MFWFQTQKRLLGKYIFVIISLVNGNFFNFPTVNGQDGIEEHQILKRMDLESCLGQFDIQQNMIIRTEESLAIGGKYLQGIGLETVEECKRLCCETEFCDVFVFEEKAEQYCYLFECGRPDNFRCKFTKHGNFTSAVFTPIRYIATTKVPSVTSPTPTPAAQQNTNDRPNAPFPSKQEIQLKKLKIKPDAPAKIPAASTPVPMSADPPIASFSTTTKTSILAGSNGNCGRFQFQCHSGECIAIYNACDNILQCKDGSDEGPECGTPENANNVNIVQNYNRIAPPSSPNKIDDRTMHKSPPPPPTGSQPMISDAYQAQQMIQSGPSLLNREDSMTGAAIMWQNQKMPTDQQIEMKPNSEIFRHKSGLQIPSNNVGPYANSNPVIYGNLANQRNVFVPPEFQNAYQRAGVIQPQDHMILPNMNWPQSQNQYQSMMSEGALNPVKINFQQQLPPPQPPQLQSPSIKITQETIDSPSSVQIGPEMVPSPIDSIPNGNNIQTGDVNNSNLPSKITDARSKVNKEDNSKASDEEAIEAESSTEPPKKKHKHKKLQESENPTKKEFGERMMSVAEVKMPHHEGYKMEMEFVDHDGYSERPGGAVLSLTLGVLVTAALAILIGCRMRTVGRRVRRHGGKAPYGNEADFLVNGMYL